MTPDKAVFVLGFLGVAGWVFMCGGAFFLMEGIRRVRTMLLGAFGCMVGQSLLAAGVAHQESKAAGYIATLGLCASDRLHPLVRLRLTNDFIQSYSCASSQVCYSCGCVGDPG